MLIIHHRGDDDLSGMLLNSQQSDGCQPQNNFGEDTALYGCQPDNNSRGFGEDTALELAICPPTLGDDTDQAIESTMDTTGPPRDFVQENMKV